jgi:hypothetical protein
VFAGLRGHLTYANVVSTLCLFLLLGGVGYAAFKLPKNSVASKHIKDGQVANADLAPAAVQQSNLDEAAVGSDAIGEGAVGSSELQLGSVTGDHVSGLTGDDIDEGTLGAVPDANQLGGFAPARFQNQYATVVLCQGIQTSSGCGGGISGTVELDLPAASNVLATADSGVYDPDSGSFTAECFFKLDGSEISGTRHRFGSQAAANHDSAGHAMPVSLHNVIAVPEGEHNISLDCDTVNGGPFYSRNGSFTAIRLSG